MEEFSFVQAIVDVLVALLPTVATLVGLFIGFHKFNKTHELKTVEVNAEAASDNAVANTTMFDLYERMLNNRLEQDTKFLEMNVEFNKLKFEVDVLKKDYEREKKRGDKFEQLATHLQEQLDDERKMRLEVQDDRDSLRREMAILRESISAYKQIAVPEQIGAEKTQPISLTQTP
jgi:DNA gyrase/topoisomerase IV subunit A